MKAMTCSLARHCSYSNYLKLPELSGIEVCRRLRHTSDIPIIMLTAKDDMSD